MLPNNMDIEFPRYLDIIDGSISDCLDGFTNYWLGFTYERTEPALGKIVYTLSVKDWGQFGKITLRKIDLQRTLVEMGGPKHVSTEPISEEEKVLVNDAVSKEERNALIIEITKRKREEARSLWNKQKDHFSWILRDWFRLLYIDRILTPETDAENAEIKQNIDQILTQKSDIDEIEKTEHGRLIDELVRCFNKDELHDLMFDYFNIESDEIKGNTRREIAREIVQYTNRLSQLVKLLKACKKERANFEIIK